MQRIVLVYGAIAAVILETSLALMIALGAHGGIAGMVLGYLSMLIAMSMVFVGIKRYRDEHQGGVIRFGTALTVGFGIAAIAALGYVLGWELYMWATGYRFAPEYAASALAAKRAAGATPQQLAALKAELDGFVASYANAPYRMAMTLSEIAPVALLVPPVAALVLRRSEVLPAIESLAKGV